VSSIAGTKGRLCLRGGSTTFYLRNSEHRVRRVTFSFLLHSRLPSCSSAVYRLKRLRPRAYLSGQLFTPERANSCRGKRSRVAPSHDSWNLPAPSAVRRSSIKSLSIGSVDAGRPAAFSIGHSPDGYPSGHPSPTGRLYFIPGNAVELRLRNTAKT